MTVVTIVLSIACFIVGGFASYLFFKHGLKNKRKIEMNEDAPQGLKP